MPELISEAGPTIGGTPTGSGRIRVTLITPGWGSSGYYSPEILEQAVTDGVFHAGLQMFLDHPTQREANERPVRSVKDLAAVLTENATWTGSAVEADAQLVGPHVEAFGQPEMAGAIGVSIRASADDVTLGEADGRRGRIIGRLVEAQSVDFVTRAGRGGRYQVIESALPSQVVHRAVDNGVSEATANQLRDGLQSALRDAYGGDKSWVWIRDFDDSLVWYEHESPDGSGLYQHTYSETGGAVALTGTPVEVRQVFTYVPVDPADSTPTQESDQMTQLDEAANGPVTAAGDKKFLKAMIPHHQAAVDMVAKADLTDARVKALAAGITRAQTAEITKMRGWLGTDAPKTTTGKPGMSMESAPSTDNTPKEGLVPELSEAEVTALRNSAAQAEAERNAALAEAATLKAQIAARPKVAAKVAESKALAGRVRTQARIVESVVAALPIVEGAIADEAIATAVEAAVADAEAELAEGQSTTIPTVFGSFGSVTESAAGQTAELSESDVTSAVGTLFGRKAG